MESWLAEVDHFLQELVRQEENDWMQRGRKRCRYCGTKERDDDDGAWLHDPECPYAWAWHLYLSKPLASA